jgi:hypothetical protein
MWRLLFLILMLAGLPAPAARAQAFGPPLPLEHLLVLLDRHGNPRFTFGSYYTEWQNPFTIRLTAFNTSILQPVSATVRVVGDTPASPLFEGTYAMGPRWAVGFWFNPLRREHLRKKVKPIGFDTLVDLNLRRDVDLADLHLTYYGPSGLSAQVGYYREHGTISDFSAQRAKDRSYKLVSWNVWLTERLDVRAHRLLITPFVSAGYHPSVGLNHAVSVLTGVSVSFNRRLSLSGSVWWFDLSDPSTRITGGLVYRL